MLKIINLLIGIVLLVLILILYFQNIEVGITFSYFSSKIGAVGFITQIFFFSFLAGVFLTLGIKGLLSGDNNVNDDFKL